MHLYLTFKLFEMLKVHKHINLSICKWYVDFYHNLIARLHSADTATDYIKATIPKKPARWM